jgi:heme-degrading monooxygenase HmoA
MTSMSNSDQDFAAIMIRFDVPKENQAALVTVMCASLDEVISRHAGFIDGMVLPGDDGTHVIHLSRWRHRDDIEAPRQDPRAKEFAAQMSGLGATPHPVVYSKSIPFSGGDA